LSWCFFFSRLSQRSRIPECTLCGRDEVVGQDELGQLLCEEHKEEDEGKMLDKPVHNGFPVFGTP
jgi:hypothetical protein